MKSLCVLLVVLTACGTEKSSSPGAAPASAGSGDGSDAEIDAFLADFTAYGDKAVMIIAKFDGDCGATADQMLMLEPLAQKLRARGQALEADPARKLAMKRRTSELQPQILRHYDELLKPLGLTMANVGTKESEMKTKCAGDAKWADAIERTGLKKKK